MSNLMDLFTEQYKIDVAKESAVDIITFVESPDYLHLSLFPVQRFILRLCLGLPLDDNLKEPILLYDKFYENLEHTFYSESEFKQWLYDTDRLNSLEHDLPIIESYLIIGRRGTKTTITALISAYTLYLILLNDDPHKYFNIMYDSEIAVTLCSNNKFNASRQFRELTRLLYRCKFFKPFLTVKDVDKVSGFKLSLYTRKFLNTKKGGMIAVSVYAVNSGVRGGSNVIFIGDEYAHYIDSEKSTKEKPLDVMIYEAVTPSLSGFRTPDGKPFGKSFFISSPNGKRGRTYSVFVEAKDDRSVLFLKMPSWWVNPNISSRFLRKMYDESEMSFLQEYAAEFITSGSSQWIRRIEYFYNSTCSNLKSDDTTVINLLECNPSSRYRYYGAVDLALSGDGAVISICHYESNYKRNNDVTDEYMKDEGIYIFDYVWYTYPDSNTSTRIRQVINVMIQCMYKFRLDKIIIDGWSSEMFLQYLEDMSMENIDNKDYIKLRKIIQVVNTTQSNNSDYARIFRTILVDGKIAYPKDDEIIIQLTGLKEKITSIYVKVENVSGKDDIPNSMFKSLYSCVNDKNRDKPISLNHRNTPNAVLRKNFRNNTINTRMRNKIDSR